MKYVYLFHEGDKDQKDLLKQLAESMGSDVKPQEDRGFMGKIKDALG